MTYLPPRRSDGSIQSRRVPQPWPKDRPFRILSIDGGGICGILPAAVLAELEHRFLQGNSIAGYFDMIAGTSTGGIIALALAYGKTGGEIRDIYMEKGGAIFPPASKLGRLIRLIRQGHRTVYERGPLEDELLKIFGEATFGEAKTRLCIPAFEGRHGEPWIFKTKFLASRHLSHAPIRDPRRPNRRQSQCGVRPRLPILPRSAAQPCRAR